MVTTWVPLVPVTRSSGCMYVVPADKDALLTRFEDPHHLRPDDATCALGEATGRKQRNLSGSTSLNLRAGDVLGCEILQLYLQRFPHFSPGLALRCRRDAGLEGEFGALG